MSWGGGGGCGQSPQRTGWVDVWAGLGVTKESRAVLRTAWDVVFAVTFRQAAGATVGVSLGSAGALVVVSERASPWGVGELSIQPLLSCVAFSK